MLTVASCSADSTTLGWPTVVHSEAASPNGSSRQVFWPAGHVIRRVVQRLGRAGAIDLLIVLMCHVRGCCLRETLRPRACPRDPFGTAFWRRNFGPVRSQTACFIEISRVCTIQKNPTAATSGDGGWESWLLSVNLRRTESVHGDRQLMGLNIRRDDVERRGRPVR